MQLQAVYRRLRLDAKRRAPEPPPTNWTVGPPDFVGIGAQRSGTTWWYDLVSSHPRVVHRGDLKELHYFHRFSQRPFTDADVDTYHRFFPRPTGHLSGEWSPGYLSHFWVPPLLHRAAPDAKLLLLLRDPIERYRSGVALQTETGRPSARAASAAFRIGCYATQLEQLFGWFPREQVLVLQFERCVADPGPELARTFRFLGLDDDFVPDDLVQPRNQARVTKAPLPDHTHEALVHAYAPEVAALPGLVADLDVALWRNFAHLGNSADA